VRSVGRKEGTAPATDFNPCGGWAKLEGVAASPGNVQVRTLELRESTILVVDDEASGRDLLSCLLTSQGYRVKTASDGSAGLNAIEAGGIDLVLLDLMMAKMDGVEVCTHIRKAPETALLPVVFTTSLHDRASRIRAKEAGADDFLVKPIDGLELLVRVEQLLRTRAQTALLVAERDRLAKELSKTRASALAASEPVTAAPTPALQELIAEHRRLLMEAQRDLTADASVAARLEQLVRSIDDIERRSVPPSTPFPFPRTRSTL
jgi:DNA-binding response OmpR family regulator